ncbi:hypothetical protein OG524_36725 (plasmid) [Streptomyces sp. NBC_01520]|uniref:hypothetical protein n=1 Tax=Streptomyces sp. NBC_01520 TaxID=2903892 RepID=UPI002F91174E
MGELQPLSGEVTPEALALAKALRELLSALEVSARRYSVRRHYNPGTISRYLSGRRLPPWDFVFNLLQDAAEKRGGIATAEAVALLRKFHNDAFKASGTSMHKVQLLEQQLEEADREAQKSAARERWLEETLQDRERQLRDLQVQAREIQMEDFTSFSQTAAAPSSAADPIELHEERDRLEEEVRQLRGALREAYSKHEQAEARCEYLERQLAKVEQGSPGPQFGYELDAPEHFNRGGRPLHSPDWRDQQALLSEATVRIDRDGEFAGAGILFDAFHVITTANISYGGMDGWQVHQGKKSAEGVVIEAIPARPDNLDEQPRPTPFPNLAVLRLSPSSELSAPNHGIILDDFEPLPGDELVVQGWEFDKAANRVEMYSCVVRVQGKSGSWIRVDGDWFVPGLSGAPALHKKTGRLVAIVATRLDRQTGGRVIPLSAISCLKSLAN